MSAQASFDTWQKMGACRAPHHVEVFFPPSHFERKHDRAERERRAKAICRSCPVADHCLTYALEYREPHGVWGGLNEIERRELMVRSEAGGEPPVGRPRGR